MNLQEQINTAVPSATITIPDNERCIGNFIISKPLTIVGGVNNSILTPNADPVFEIKPGTGPVVLRKLNISAVETVTQIHDLVRYGGADLASGQTSLDKVPQGLWLDECDIYGLPHIDSHRGVSANGANFKATKTKIREIHGRGYDTQAICSWNGPGPFVIEDCYLEAAGENVMFGGSLPIIPNLVHSDITVRRCVFFKPLEWRGVWSVKNLFELKNARRVVIEGCVFENNWTDAQAGRAIVFTPRPSDSGHWAVVEDVIFQNNIIRNVGSGIILLGADEAPAPTETRLRRVIVRNNLWIIDGPKFGSNGVFATVINKTEDVTIEHNTAIQTSSMVVTDYAPNSRFVYQKNVARHNEYGIFGSGVGIGNPAIAHYFPDGVVANNVIAKEINAPSNVESLYPAGNYFPASLSMVLDSDYRVIDPAYPGIGCDVDALNAALSDTTPIPIPEPTTPEPIPEPVKIPSPDGTKGATIIDSELATWSIGPSPEFKTLRNGTQAGGGQGTLYKYLNSTVYVLGMDANWWGWIGGSWRFVGPEPGVTEPQPIPEPIPEPQPEPPPPATRTISNWPTSPKHDAKRNQILDQQWGERYRLKRTEGSTAEFAHEPG